MKNMFFHVYQVVFMMELFTLFDECCLMLYFKRQRKSRRGNFLNSRDIYFQLDLPSTFTIILMFESMKESSLQVKLAFYFLFH